jgi:putative acetyltransferase
LIEFGMNKPGTVFTDPTTDQLFETFQGDNTIYFVAEENTQIIGGCGIFPTNGLPTGCGELVKLYVLQKYRNVGLGKVLMEKSIKVAKEMGYTQLYLETMPELSMAVSLYEKLGFYKIAAPLGNSGHFACDLWMVKEL